MKTMPLFALANLILWFGFFASLAQDMQQKVRLIGDLDTRGDDRTAFFDGDSAVLAGPNLMLATDGVLTGAELWRVKALARFRGARGLAVDKVGNVLVADTENHVIRRVGSDGVVTTIAGAIGRSGYRDGQGSYARFNRPMALAVDLSSSPMAGSIFVADCNNHAIRRITPAGVVETVMGARAESLGIRTGEPGLVNQEQPSSVSASGPGLRFPEGIALWSTGPASTALPQIYIADTGNHILVKLVAISVSSWQASLYAGSNAPGPPDARRGLANAGPENPPATGPILFAARFDEPAALQIDQPPRSGNSTPLPVVYVADRGNNLVRRISTPTRLDRVDSIGSFFRPQGLALDNRKPASPGTNLGGLFVAETGAHRLLRLANPATGTPVAELVAGLGQGIQDGAGASAGFNMPSGLAMLGSDLLVADTGNHSLRLIDLEANSTKADGTVSLFSGYPGQAGDWDGGSDAAALSQAPDEPPYVLTDAVAGRGGSDPSQPVILNRGSGRTPLTFFSALDDLSRRRLWCSDGSSTGTFILGESLDSLRDVIPQAGMVAVGQTLFFVAEDGSLEDLAPVLWQVVVDAKGQPGQPTQVLGPEDRKVRSSTPSLTPGESGRQAPGTLWASGEVVLMSADLWVEGQDPDFELWASLPPAAGKPRTVKRLKNLQSGTGGSNPRDFKLYDDWVYFKAEGSDDSNAPVGTELFRLRFSTVANEAPAIELFANLRAGQASSDPRDFQISGVASASVGAPLGKFYFTALAGLASGESGLYAIDPTTSDPDLRIQRLVGAEASDAAGQTLQTIGALAPISLANAANSRNTVLFVGRGEDTGDLGLELYRYDPNPTVEGRGILLVKDITDSGDSNLDHFVTLGGSRVVFTNVRGREIELWATDGYADLESGECVKLQSFANSEFRATALVGSNLYFMIGLDELWRTDGFRAERVARFRQTNRGSGSGNYCDLGENKLAFNLPGEDNSTVQVRVLDKISGLVTNVNLSSDSVLEPQLAGFIPIGSGRFLFTALGSGLVHLMLAQPGADAYTARSLAIIQSEPFWDGSYLYFAYDDPDDSAQDTELGWMSAENLTQEGSKPNVVDVNPGDFSSRPGSFASFDGRLWFSADYREAGISRGREIFMWEPPGYELRGSVGGTPRFPNGRLIGRANAGPVFEIGAADLSSDPAEFLPVLYGTSKQMFFVARGEGQLWKNAGRELFVSNGLLAPLPNGVAGSTLSSVKLTRNIAVWENSIVDALNGFDNQLTQVEQLVYFVAEESNNGAELWRSNGTEAGTTLVGDIRPGGAGSGIRNLCRAGNKLFFVANDGGGEALYVVSGPKATPLRLRALQSIGELVGLGDMIAFTAFSSFSGQELWGSDGTMAGTRILYEWVPGLGSSSPRSLYGLSDSELIVSARDDVYGDEPRMITLITDMEAVFTGPTGNRSVLGNALGKAEVPPEAVANLTGQVAQNFGTIRSPLQISLNNVGTRVVNGISVRIDGLHAAEFVLKTLPASTLTFGASTNIAIQFIPRESGLRQARLTILSSDADEPVREIILQGTCSKDPTVDNTQMRSAMRRVGESVSFTVGVSSSMATNELGLQWFLNNRVLPAAPWEAANSQLYLASVRLADAGLYQARFTRDAAAPRGAGIGSSDAVNLGVAEDYSPARVLVLRAGSKASISCVAAGVGLSYRWERLSGAPLPASATGQGTKTLSIAALVDAFEDTYRCVVSNAGGSVTAASTLLVVHAATEQPAQLAAASLPAARVGAPYTHGLSSHLPVGGFVSAFVATGLPAGLKLDPLSGVIAGVPTISGTFTVKLGTRLGANASPTQDVVLSVGSAPSGIDGIYHGWVQRDAAVNDDAGGRLELTIAKTGILSGKLIVGSTSTPFTGNMRYTVGQSEAGGFEGRAVIARPAPLTAWSLEFRIAENATALNEGAVLKAIDGSGSAQSNGNLASAGVRAWKAMPASTELTSCVGRYHAAMELGQDVRDLPSIAQGTGFLIATVAANGTVRIEGSTADGEKLLGSTFVGAGRQLLIYQGLYSTLRRGSLMGELPLSLGANPAVNRMDGEVTWTRPAQNALTPVSATAATRTYRGGFGLPFNAAPLTLTVVGGMYATNPKAAPAVLLNAMSQGASSSLVFAAGGLGDVLGDARQNLRNPNATVLIDGASRLSVTPQEAPSKTALTAARPTGLFGGSFVLQDPDLTTAVISNIEITRQVRFSGLIVPYTPQEHRGVGWFLMPQIPMTTNGTAFRIAPILSGSVTWTINR